MKILQTDIVFKRLYMPNKAQIKSVFGEQIAQNAEKARGELEIIAKNVDLYVNPYVRITELKALPLFKVEINQLKPKSHNKFLEIISSIFRNEDNCIYADSKTFVEDLIKTAKLQVEKLKPLN